MAFKEQEASVQYEKLDGKDVPFIKPEVWVTLTNTETGQEYQSDKPKIWAILVIYPEQWVQTIENL